MQSATLVHPKISHSQRWYHRFTAAFLSSSLMVPLVASIAPWIGNSPVQAQTMAYCRLSPDAVAQKERLRQAALTGNPDAQKAYNDLLVQHAREVGNCRVSNWPRNQGIWLRLYPCDAKSGNLGKLLDDIVNKGYNQVYIEAFYDGQVLLPAAQNNTVWPSVIRTPGMENVDLLAQALQESRKRGLKAYAWMFSLNFGYTYSQRPDRQAALARNGKGQTTLTVISDNESLHDQVGESHANHAFVDPYSPIARQDYTKLVNAVLDRHPSGVLFDYIRYLRGVGAASVVDNVKDLWIYGEASQQALLQRALNPKGQELIRRYLKQGYITANDVEAVNKLYPDQKAPFWQGKNALPTLAAILPTPTPVPTPSPSQTPTPTPTPTPPPSLQQQLWWLSVAHATQGILDFLKIASQPVQERGLTAGAVFFPGGNQRIREQGFDSRLQPWDQFPATTELHPMAYATCGNNDASCVIAQVQRVLDGAPAGAKIVPALAGMWGKPFKNRPSIEQQMAALRNVSSRIDSVSHFSYDWIEPELSRERQRCR